MININSRNSIKKSELLQNQNTSYLIRSRYLRPGYIGINNLFMTYPIRFETESVQIKTEHLSSLFLNLYLYVLNILHKNIIIRMHHKICFQN
jgi:hypothetical protein